MIWTASPIELSSHMLVKYMRRNGDCDQLWNNRKTEYNMSVTNMWFEDVEKDSPKIWGIGLSLLQIFEIVWAWSIGMMHPFLFPLDTFHVTQLLNNFIFRLGCLMGWSISVTVNSHFLYIWIILKVTLKLELKSVNSQLQYNLSELELGFIRNIIRREKQYRMIISYHGGIIDHFTFTWKLRLFPNKTN